MDNYQVGKVLGEGTFGIVYLATQKDTNRTVAIKQFKKGKFKDGVNFTALREIKLQSELHHENVTELVDVFVDSADTINVVFEFLPVNMEDMVKAKHIVFTPSDIKAYLKMILQGIQACHEHFILHRDLKPENLLVDSDGHVKLGDFGLARVFGSPNRNMTSLVCTIWYRPPELLFGAREYSTSVDMWGIGCILAELLLRVPLFTGTNEIDMLGKIFHVLGTPNEQTWPGVTSLPNYIEFTPNTKMDLTALFTAASPDCLDLLSKLLALDPNHRISASDALAHDYFTNAPVPTNPIDLPKLNDESNQP